MADTDPPLIDSPLSQIVNRDGISVQVAIYKLKGDQDWTLEVVNQTGTSTVWEEPFSTDTEAFEAFERTVEEEGIETFFDDDDEEGTTLH